MSLLANASDTAPITMCDLYDQATSLEASFSYPFATYRRRFGSTSLRRSLARRPPAKSRPSYKRGVGRIRYN